MNKIKAKQIESVNMSQAKMDDNLQITASIGNITVGSTPVTISKYKEVGGQQVEKSAWDLFSEICQQDKQPTKTDPSVAISSTYPANSNTDPYYAEIGTSFTVKATVGVTDGTSSYGSIELPSSNNMLCEITEIHLKLIARGVSEPLSTQDNVTPGVEISFDSIVMGGDTGIIYEYNVTAEASFAESTRTARTLLGNTATLPKIAACNKTATKQQFIKSYRPIFYGYLPESGNDAVSDADIKYHLDGLTKARLTSKTAKINAPTSNTAHRLIILIPHDKNINVGITGINVPQVYVNTPSNRFDKANGTLTENYSISVNGITINYDLLLVTISGTWSQAPTIDFSLSHSAN